MTNASHTVSLNKQQIKEHAEDSHWFDIYPCSLCGENLGLHTRLTIQDTISDDGDIIRRQVTDCNRVSHS